MIKLVNIVAILLMCSIVSFGQDPIIKNHYNIVADDGNGVRFWESDSYKIHMGNNSTEYHFGPVTDFSIKTNMSGGIIGRGWTWGIAGQTPVAAINILGNMQIAGSFKTLDNIEVGNKLVVGNSLTNSLSTKGIVLGEDGNELEFLNSSFGSGYGAKLYGSDEGAGLTSFRMAVRGNSSTWTDALYMRAADSGSGGGKLGFIGIGTNDPQARLEVHESTALGATTGDNQLLFRVSGRGSNHFMHNQWLLRDSPGTQWWYARLHDGVSIDGSFITPGTDTRTWWERDPHDNIQSWGHADQTYLTINQGYVGIGTTTPDAKLTVAGDIHSREVKVTVDAGTGPDYVFEPTYNLPTLTEIETYIKANKHLPEVPSAKEMETNGINLSEMNMLLLKKVEELTLHLIELKKENNETKKENDRQNQLILELLNRK